MSLDIRDYDLATLNRFKKFFERTYWVNKPNLEIMEVRNRHILENSDVQFPIVIIRRVSAPTMYKETNSWSAGRTGDQLGRTRLVDENGKLYSADITMVQSNFEMKYMLEVFSFERDNFDELFIELQENIFRYPYITFENYKNEDKNIKDLQVDGMSTNIMVESCDDNTDLESFTSQTPFYRGTISFSIRAYIYRKYGCLLIDSIGNNYNILDYKKDTKQIVTGVI